MHFTSRTKQTDSQPTILCIIIIQMFAGSEGGSALGKNLSRIKFWLRSKIKPWQIFVRQIRASAVPGPRVLVMWYGLRMRQIQSQNSTIPSFLFGLNWREKRRHRKLICICTISIMYEYIMHRNCLLDIDTRLECLMHTILLLLEKSWLGTGTRRMPPLRCDVIAICDAFLCLLFCRFFSVCQIN